MHANTLEPSVMTTTESWNPVLCPTCGAHVLLADGGVWQCQNAHCGARWLDKAPDAERGLVDQLPGIEDGPGGIDLYAAAFEADDDSFDPSQLTEAQTLAQYLANVIQAPTYVITQNGAYFVQDEQDVSCYWHDPDSGKLIADALILSARAPRAVTRQSQAIEAKLTTCSYCRGIHHIQKCPSLRQALFRPAADTSWKDVALGRELCRMRWRDFGAFVALLLSAPADQLIVYARSYQTFIRDHSPESNMTINDVLQAWGRIISSDRGPKGAALSVAA